MWQGSIGNRRILVSYSHVEVDDFPLLPRSLPLSTLLRAARAFADGFLSSLVGGLVYCLILVFYYPGELGLGWFRVLVLSGTFGCVEMWRVMRRRTFRDMKAGLLWAFTANVFMWWALGVSLSVPPHYEPAGPDPDPGALARPRNS
jgi:hypothetical protein